jgi:chemotaxis protein CheD
MVQCTTEKTARSIQVGMGQAIVADGLTCLVATLGASVGLSLYSRERQIGILGHIVLPQTIHRTAMPAKYANVAVPYMVEVLQQHGVQPLGLVAKLAGGACMFGDKEVGQIGAANIAAVLQSLVIAGIEVTGSDVGGSGGRRITFDAETGGLNIQTFGTPAFIL